jgi:hypothetical protein
MLIPLHHHVHRDVIVSRRGVAVEEGREKLGGDDDLQRAIVSALH